jgi:hypothetical protein
MEAAVGMGDRSSRRRPRAELIRERICAQASSHKQSLAHSSKGELQPYDRQNKT